MWDFFARAIPPLFTVAAVCMFLLGTRWLLLRRIKELSSGQVIRRQVSLAFLTLVGAVTVILALPIPTGSRNQLIALLGLIVSAAIALSSTNILANAMAGLLLRSTRPFRVGDYIKIQEYAGRVTERGLFDTEVQSELRELIAIPNTFFITHPVKTLRSSGALVSCSLSLGFDVHHVTIEKLLTAAAELTGLDGPFVRITEIGDFSVTYRVSGMLKELDSLLSTQSNLHRNVLDTLHGGGVEIVSPSFMNTRGVAEQTRFIPTPIVTRAPVVEDNEDAVVFDKAMDAEAAEARKLELTKEIETLTAEAKAASGDEKAGIQERIAARREQLSALQSAEGADSPDDAG